AWADASSYADQLAAVLSDQGFVAFIDKREYSAGDDLKRSAQRALRKSGFLVVILSNAALESRDVLEEVETFKPSGRKILVLDTERLREENLDNPLVQAIGPDTLDIRGDVGSLRAGPSSHAVGEIARSYDLTRQSQRRLRWIASIAALLFVLAASAGFLGLMADQGRKEAIRQENLAKQQRDVAISKQLAVRANRNLEENLDLALILSVQGVQIDDNWETRDSLLSALQKAQGVRAFLHPQGDIAFSPNGRFLAYQADKHITRVYDTDSGSLRTLRLDSPEARRLIAISPDGSLVVTWRDSVLEVWQVPTGNLVKRVEFGELPLRCPVAEVGLPLTKALVKVTKKIEKLLRRRIADKDSSPTP
ncbi:MAG: TIR domain-containing protein, partial [Deltaproteobacteria bacterium]|nr:TIR domain-containing protein [Deltaproteobacteria bacterium]